MPPAPPPPPPPPPRLFNARQCTIQSWSLHISVSRTVGCIAPPLIMSFRVPLVSATLARLCTAPPRLLGTLVLPKHTPPRCFTPLLLFHSALSSHVASDHVSSAAAAPRTRAPRKAALVVTEAAAARLKHLMQGQEQAIGIKIGVRQRGCNGYTYAISSSPHRHFYSLGCLHTGTRWTT
jgi:hypothetical protein